MLELKGKYNTAKVFTDVVDDKSISQVIELLNQPFAEGSCIRMMPDIHAGSGCTIGTTMSIKDAIVPNLVGVDIGCGMEVAQLEETELDLPELDKVIYARIPSGFSIRNRKHKRYAETHLKDLYCLKIIDLSRAEKSCGTLGGGNHFIEADRDDEGKLYIVVHSGSRHLGMEVAEYYQKEAVKQIDSWNKSKISYKIAEMKDSGMTQDIEKTIAEIKRNVIVHVPNDLAYVSGNLFDNYIHDMKIVQEYAVANRQAMMDEIVEGMNLHITETFTTIHNYIDTENMILRKGAVSAAKDEKFIIPINMRDGSLICMGKGNPDWNSSAPHGAGRLLSRSAAKGSFSVDEFEKQMEGIYSTSIGQSTLDECPMAYKNMEDIVNNIEPTADILKIIKPVYNFKAGVEKAPWEK